MIDFYWLIEHKSLNQTLDVVNRYSYLECSSEPPPSTLRTMPVPTSPTVPVKEAA